MRVFVWSDTSRYPNALRQVALPIVASDVCNRPNWYNGRVDETMICAGYEEGGQDSCQVGDPKYIQRGCSEWTFSSALHMTAVNSFVATEI